MRAILSTQRLLHCSLPQIQQKRQIFSWTKTKVIDPICEIATNACNDPINVSVTIASVCVFSYVLREYVSRKILYVPHNTFEPGWKSFFEFKNVKYKEIEFKNIVNDEIGLHGLYIEGNNKKYSKYPLLFVHGNAGNISHRIDNLLLLHHSIGCDIFIFDYRGYGKSSTKYRPTQKGLIEDTISAMKELVALKQLQNNINSKDIQPIIFGRSLGGAVAIHSIQALVQEYGVNVGGIIIENSFTSTWDCVGNNFLYPFIADKWDNIQCLETLKNDENITNIPILFISATNDTLLDPQMMKNLRDYTKYNAHFTKVISKEFEDADHNDTYLCNGYVETLDSFLQFVDSKSISSKL